MPTYEYKCLKCSNLFEVFQSMKDEPVKTCPKCKGEVKRLIGRGAGTIFKGSGFYQTDYKNSSNTAYKKAAEKAEGPKKTSEDKPNSKKTTNN